MSETPKDKDQDKADERRDELAKRVLNTPPQPKHGKPTKDKALPDPKTGKEGTKPKKDKPDELHPKRN